MQIFRSFLIFRKQIYQKIDRKIIEIIINKDIKNIYILKLTVTCTVSIFAGDDFCVGRKAEKQREKKKISNSLKEQITIIKKKKSSVYANFKTYVHHAVRFHRFVHDTFKNRMDENDNSIGIFHAFYTFTQDAATNTRTSIIGICSIQHSCKNIRLMLSVN